MADRKFVNQAPDQPDFDPDKTNLTQPRTEPSRFELDPDKTNLAQPPTEPSRFEPDPDKTNLTQPPTEPSRFEPDPDQTNLTRPAQKPERFSKEAEPTEEDTLTAFADPFLSKPRSDQFWKPQVISPPQRPTSTGSATQASSVASPSSTPTSSATPPSSVTPPSYVTPPSSLTSASSATSAASGPRSLPSEDSNSLNSLGGSLAGSLPPGHRSLGAGRFGAGQVDDLINPGSLAAQGSTRPVAPNLFQPAQPCPRPYDGNFFEAPPEEESVVKAPFAWKRLLMVIAGAVVLAIIAGLLYLNVFRKPTVAPETLVTATPGNTKTAEAASGKEVVENYLNALAEGDVNKALSFGQVGPGQLSAITNDTYSRSRNAAPITDIRVDEMTAGATTVRARYKIGDHETEADYALVRSDSGGWRLAKATITFNFNMPNAEHVPLLINGVPIDKSNPVELVPGSYEISTGLPYIAFLENTTQLVTSLDYPESNDYPLTTVITESGADALTRAAAQSLNGCFSRRELAPSGCPISIRTPSRPIVHETIQWTLSNDPWYESLPTLSQSDQSVGEIPIVIQAGFSVSYADGTTAGNTTYTFDAVAYADLTVTNAEDIQIFWR